MICWGWFRWLGYGLRAFFLLAKRRTCLLYVHNILVELKVCESATLESMITRIPITQTIRVLQKWLYLPWQCSTRPIIFALIYFKSEVKVWSVLGLAGDFFVYIRSCRKNHVFKCSSFSLKQTAVFPLFYCHKMVDLLWQSSCFI